MTIDHLLKQIDSFASLEANWDSYGAEQIDPGVIDHAKRLIRSIALLVPDHTPAPSVVPTSRGGVQFEWHIGGVDVEIEIHPDGTIEYLLTKPPEEPTP